MVDWLIGPPHADSGPVSFPLLTDGSTRLSRTSFPPEQTETSCDDLPLEPAPVSAAVTRILGMIGSAIVVVQTGSATMLVSLGGAGPRLSDTIHPQPSPAPCPNSAVR